ncbi:MAG: 5-oxoprolinase subunit PxpB [Microvirga sp.]
MTSGTDENYPRFRPAADVGVMVEFGETISDEVHAAVFTLDKALAAHPFHGFTETVPAYCSLFVGYDPLLAEFTIVKAHVSALVALMSVSAPEGRLHEVPVCYDAPFGPDLASVAEQVGLSPEGVIEAHLAGAYRVYMYGFAPGYAYLGGVPDRLQLPRKASPVRDIPAGSVLIAGPQCLVTTIMMPTGWWIIGRSPAQILRPQHEMPFLFEVGDKVKFYRVDASQLAVDGEGAT